MNTEANELNLATLIIVNNPFNPKDNSRHDVVTDEKPTIADLIPDEFEEYVVALNGHIAQNESQIVLAGDYVVLSPVPLGGGGEGGAKSVLRVAALMAVTYFSLGAGSVIGANGLIGTSLAKGSFSLFAAQTLTFAAGSALVNSVLPIEPSVPKLESSLEESSSYGIDGPKTTAKEGGVVPVVYGTYRVAGNLVNAHVDNSDDQHQILSMRMALSEGEIGDISIDSILIDDQSISDYDDIQHQSNVGSRDQEVSSWFPNSITATSVNIPLSTDFTSRTTDTEVDKFRVDLVAPAGFRKIDGARSEPIVEDLTIEYKKDTDPDDAWVSLPASSQVSGYTPLYRFTTDLNKWYSASDEQRHNPGMWFLDEPLYNDEPIHPNHPNNYVLVGEDGFLRMSSLSYDPANVTPTGSALEEYKFIVGVYVEEPLLNESPSMRGLYKNTYRASFESPELEQGKYDVRVKRDTAEQEDDEFYIDQIVWSDLNEILVEEVALANTAWLALKIRMDDQLSKIPNVSVIISGMKIKTFRMAEDETEPQIEYIVSSNPAWIAYDMLTNKRYGGGISEDRLDLAAWIEWSEYCIEEGLEFNGTFDQDMTLWDALQVVFRVGRAQILNLGTRFSITIERLSQPVMMFNVSNIIEKTFSVSWLPISDRANEIEVTYYDKDNEFLPHTLRVSDAGVPGSSSKRKAEINLFGVTDARKAVKEAQLMLNLNKYALQTVTFDAHIDAIACSVGDVVYIQHDMPNWGAGGRLIANSTNSQTGFVLDQEVEIELGKDYELLLTYDYLLRETTTVSAVVASRFIRLNSGIPSGNLKRIEIDGEEYGIVSTFTDSVGEGVQVNRDVPGTVVGLSCNIYDTDVIESRTLSSTTVGGAGSYSELSVDSPFSGSADKYTKFMFGEVSQIKKPFRISSINLNGEFSRTISAVEYNENAYSDTSASSSTVNNGSFVGKIKNVTGLSAIQENELFGNVYKPVVSLSWDRPDDERYIGAEVLVRQTNGAWETAGNTERGSTQFDYRNALVGQTLEFKVIARDVLGGKATAASAPTVSISVTATGELLTGPTELNVTADGELLVISWKNAIDANYKETEIFRGEVDDFEDVSTQSIHRTSGESFVDSSFTVGTQYFYWAKSINTDGNAGTINAQSGTTLPVPIDPQNLAILNGFVGTTAEIGWDAQTDAHHFEVDVETDTVIRRTAEIVENHYRYGLEEMVHDGNVSRHIVFGIRAINIMGMASGTSIGNADNDPPALPSMLSITPGFQVIRFEFIAPIDPDYLETRIWMNPTSGFIPSDTNLVAQTHGGPVVITNLEDNTTYYIRMATYDSFGQGTMSEEWVATTEDAGLNGLSPWATVTEVDRAFIDENIADGAIEGTKITKITAGQIITGTLAATENVSVEGTVETIRGGHTVTMGPHSVDGNISLLSYVAGSTPIMTLNEDGTALFTGKVVIQSGSSGYGDLTDIPSQLSDINSAEGGKLDGIEDGATANDLSDVATSGGSLVFNPDTKIVGADGRPAGVKACYGGTTKTNVKYQNVEKTVLELYSDVDSEIGCGFPAFRVREGTTYTFIIRVKSDADIGAGFYFRMNELSTELVGDYTHISVTEGEEGVYTTGVTDKSVGIDDAPITTAWTTHTVEYTPTTGTKWASPIFLNWTGMGTNRLHIDKCYGMSNATNGATWGTDIVGQPVDADLLNSNQQWSEIGGTGKPQDNATNGATWSSDITGQPSDSELLNSNQEWSEVGGTGKPADNATVGATWGTDVNNIPQQLLDTPTDGLNLTGSYLGFYDQPDPQVTGEWRSYLDNQGRFYLNKDASDNYLAWDGATLKVRGDIVASSVEAGAIDGVEITGGTLRTAASGERIEISGADNQFHAYWNRGDGTIEELVNIGNTGTSSGAITLGSSNFLGSNIIATTNGSGRIGIGSWSLRGTGLYGHTEGAGEYGVWGQSESTGPGVYGNSWQGNGVEGTAANGYGVLGIGGEAGVKGESSFSHGIHGVSTSSTTGDAGVLGESANQSGVRGESDNFYGVLGTGGLAGVRANSTAGHGAYITTTAASSDKFGALITSASTIGVVAEGYSAGLKAVGTGPSGKGAVGEATGASARGVEGRGGLYDFYAGGAGTNYGPFTGAHDALLPKSGPLFVEGDIVKIASIAARSTLSNVLAEIELQDQVEAKDSFGVIVTSNELPDENDTAAMMYLSDAEYQTFKASHYLATVNGVGEGQVNVVGEGGNIEVGDFICTSSTPGKGKLYSGNDMRLVVARAIEPVIWENEASVEKQIACIYMCA